jgi:hypothetical protein
MQQDAIRAFDEHLRYHASLPFEWESLNRAEDTLRRELRLKRGLGVLAAQTAFDEKRSEPGDDAAQLAPELLRLDAKLNHLIDLVGALLSRTVGMPATVPVEFNAWGVAWQAAGEVPEIGSDILVRIHLDGSSALPLELPARAVESLHREDGPEWQRAVFVDLGDILSDGIERLVFRMHRRQLADGRSGNRNE